MKKPTIAELQAMDDAALSEALGMDLKLAAARASLKELDGLSGKLRAEAERRVMEMFTPREDLKWIADDMAYKKKRSGKEEMEETSPSSI